jgi:hypothetical protein
MKRTAAILKASVVVLLAVLIIAGGLAVYFYTLPPNAKAGGAAASSANGQGKLVANQVLGENRITVVYNGTSYSVPAKGPNSPSFSCPTGTSPSLCTLLQETCGNGVGSAQEPWKTCYNCVFDAGCSGDNSCDPYTHQCSSPASACQIIAGGYNQGG